MLYSKWTLCIECTTRNKLCLLLQVPFPDLTEEFTVSQFFSTREELLEYARVVAAMRNISLTISDSKKHLIGNRRAYANIRCDFGGPIRQNKIDNSRKSCSKKIGCPFLLRARQQRDGSWSLTVERGTHNHEFPDFGEGQKVGMLTPSQYRDVCEARRSGLGGNDILTKLRRDYPESSCTQRHVQNALIKFRHEERQGRSPLEQFLKLLHDNNYHVAMTKQNASDVIGNYFSSLAEM